MAAGARFWSGRPKTAKGEVIGVVQTRLDGPYEKIELPQAKSSKLVRHGLSHAILSLVFSRSPAHELGKSSSQRCVASVSSACGNNLRRLGLKPSWAGPMRGAVETYSPVVRRLHTR